MMPGIGLQDTSNLHCCQYADKHHVLLLLTAVFCAQVMVYDEAWDTVDLEGQHDTAAVPHHGHDCHQA
jgi:hypothetical protein